MKLSSLTQKSLIILNSPLTRKAEVLKTLADKLYEN